MEKRWGEDDDDDDEEEEEEDASWNSGRAESRGTDAEEDARLRCSSGSRRENS